jgi:hypothetical protein
MELVIEIGGDSVKAMHNDTFDIGFLGPKTVTRQTDIIFNSVTQKWDVYYIEIEGPMQGMRYLVDGCEGFRTYEDARQHEIRWLNCCRWRGIHPANMDGVALSRSVRDAS